MDLHLSPEQELFRSTTQRFLEHESSPAQIRKLAQTGNGFERAWWTTGAELGWTSLLVPEALNGGTVSGQPFADLVVVAEELGRFAAPGPFAVTSTVIVGLTSAGSAHAETLGKILSGSEIASWAVYEPGKGWDPMNPTMTAVRRDGGFRLSGVKDRVESGDQADFFLVAARIDGGLAQFVVRADAPGVRVEQVWSLDLTRHFATVTFEDVLVPELAMVGGVGETQAAIEKECQAMYVLQCAETAGLTDRVLGFTLRWAFDRYAFGRPLASYQAIKHRFADMKTSLEAMHAITGAAACAAQEGSEAASRLSRIASLFVSTRSLEIIQDCVQIHGGIGVTWEHDLHIYLRRATVNHALYGTPDEQRHALARLLAT